MKPKAGAVLLQDLPSPKQDDILDMIRHLRAVLNAHKMYPVGHQMIIRSIARLHQSLTGLLGKAPHLVVSISNDTLELNGERLTRPVQERDHATEIAVLFQQKGIQTLVIQARCKIENLVSFFGHIMASGNESMSARELERISIDNIHFNQVVVRRKTSHRMRDKLSIEELMDTMNRDEILQELGLDPDNLPPEVQEQLDRHASRQSYDALPSAEALNESSLPANPALAGLPEYVTNGQFVLDLLALSPNSERWLSPAQQQAARTGGHSSFSSAELPGPPVPVQDPQTMIGTPSSDLHSPPSNIPTASPQQLGFMDWSAFKNRPASEFPSALQPEAIVSSNQFGQLVQSGQFEDYLKTYFAEQRKLSQRLQLGDPEAEKDFQSPHAKVQIQEVLHQVSRALNHVNEPGIYDSVQQQVAQQITTMVPELFNQYLMELAPRDPMQARLRKSILSGLSSEKIQESQEELLGRLNQEESATEAGNVVDLLQEMVEQQLEQGVLRGVGSMLERFEKDQEKTFSQGMRFGAEKILEHLSDPTQLNKLLQQGAQRGGGEARELLAKLANKSIEQVVQDALSQEDDDMRMQRIELVVDVLRQAPPEKREQGFAPLIARLESDEGSPEEQQLLMELGRRYVPDQFEKYILRSLTEEQDPDARTQLIREAISHDTPRIRNLFMKLVQKRSFANVPDQEELILQYLHRKEEIDAVNLLFERFQDTEQQRVLRHNAIWMLGAFHSDFSLALLHQITSKPKSGDKGNDAFFDEDFRFQAVHTLTRFNRLQVAGLLLQAKNDSSLLVRSYAEHLLKDIIQENGELPQLSTMHTSDTQVAFDLNLPKPPSNNKAKQLIGGLRKKLGALPKGQRIAVYALSGGVFLALIFFILVLFGVF